MFNERWRIRNSYLKISVKVKNFLLSKTSREFFLFLFFFLIAGGFWLLQTLDNTYEAELPMRIQMKNIPQNTIFDPEAPSEVHVRVKDKGIVLLNYLLGKSFFPLQIDFATRQGRNGRIRISASDLEKQISGQLSASSKILSISPDTLNYVYAFGDSARVPVRFRGKVGTTLQHHVTDTLFSPDSVTVYAPAKQLRRITAALTGSLELTDLSDTTTRQIALAPVRGVKFAPNSVSVTFPVEMYTEKTVEVPLRGVNFPPDKAFRAFPSKVNVTFQVGAKHFREARPEDFIIHVSYEELLRASSGKYKVVLKASPEYAHQIRLTPEEVDFLIEQISPHAD